jgi:CRP-like cAMP-binding protein
MLSSSDPPVHNRLLAALPPSTSAQLQSQLEPVELTLAEYLQVPGEPLRHVYFPTGAVAILVCQIDRRPPLAVGLVGAEGLVGLPVFLGAYTARWGAQVHLAGTALRLPAEVLREICREEGPLPEQLRIYTDALLAQVIQSSACGRFHALPARLARWLLMTSDRSDIDTFPLTHQALAELLGVRREAVSNAAGALQRQRMIGYRRGLLKVMNRAGLEAIACACYRRIDPATV